MYRLTLAFVALVSFSPTCLALAPCSGAVCLQQDADALIRGKAAADELFDSAREQAATLWESDRQRPDSVPCEGCVESLCAKHQAGDDAAMLKANSEWPKASELDRLQMIKTLSLSNVEHANRSNAQVRRFLVEVMDTDKSWRIRSAAILAIGHQPGVEEAFNVLDAHLLKRAGSLREVRKKVKGSRWNIRRVKRMTLSPYNEITRIQAEGALQMSHLKLTPLLTKLTKEEAEWGALVMSFGRCKSPKASKRLLELAQGFPESALPVNLQRALLETPTHARLQCFVDRFKALEKEIKDASKEIKKVEKRKDPRPPKGYKGTPGMWAQSNVAGKIFDIEMLVDRQEQIAIQQDRLHESLVNFVEKATIQLPKLKMPKLKKVKFYSCWKSFVSSNKRSWPRTLGK